MEIPMSEKPIDLELIKNAAFPQGEAGQAMIERMNREHRELTEWGWRLTGFPAVSDPSPGFVPLSTVDYSTDDGERVSGERFRKSEGSEIAEIPPSMVLDVGCGGGMAIRRLATRWTDSTFFGCDISPTAVMTAQTVNREQIVSGQTTILQAGVSELPFPEATFDFVYSVESLYFWPDSRLGCREIHRVLKPGGIFMTVLEMVGGAMTPRHAQIAEFLKMYCPTPVELRNLLLESNFTIRTIRYAPDRGWLCGIGQK